MPKQNQLKYIVLSDFHLGEADSIFSVDKGEKPVFLESFSDCLKNLISDFNEEEELPKLVLNGDLLGLAFSSYKQTLAAFKHFVVSLTQYNKVCEKVIYIPGNHDHQIWQLAMEDHYRSLLLEGDEDSPIPELVTATSPVYEGGLPSSFLQAFMKKINVTETELKVFYPNFLLPAPTPDSPFVLFHHGHFAEDTYRVITKMMQALYPELEEPDTMEKLEHQNGAWINFAFSQLGRSGKAGKHFEELMATLSSKEKLENNKNELAHNVASSLDFPYLPFHWMEKFLSKKLITNIAEKVRTERYVGSTSCSDETMQNLMSYFEKLCYDTIKDHGWDKNPLHFVWSHTHKPFEKNTTSKVFGDIQVTNTGGWTIAPKPSAKHGASILLINALNEVQSLRVFMDTAQDEKGILRVVLPDGEKMSDFGIQIEATLYAEDGKLRQPWADFKDMLEMTFKKRRAK